MFDQVCFFFYSTLLFIFIQDAFHGVKEDCDFTEESFMGLGSEGRKKLFGLLGKRFVNLGKRTTLEFLILSFSMWLYWENGYDA